MTKKKHNKIKHGAAAGTCQIQNKKHIRESDSNNMSNNNDKKINKLKKKKKTIIKNEKIKQ